MSTHSSSHVNSDSESIHDHDGHTGISGNSVSLSEISPSCSRTINSTDMADLSSTNHYRFQVTSWKDKRMDPTNSSYLITDQQFTMVGKDVFYRSGTDHIIGWNIHQSQIKCTALYAVHLDTQFPVLLAKWIQHSQWLVLKARGGKRLPHFYQNIRVHLYTSSQHCLMQTFFNQSLLITSWTKPVQEIVPDYKNNKRPTGRFCIALLMSFCCL